MATVESIPQLRITIPHAEAPIYPLQAQRISLMAIFSIDKRKVVICPRSQRSVELLKRIVIYKLITRTLEQNPLCLKIIIRAYRVQPNLNDHLSVLVKKISKFFNENQEGIFAWSALVIISSILLSKYSSKIPDKTHFMMRLIRIAASSLP